MKNFKELLTLIPFVLGIAILANILVYQSMQIIYPQVVYENFCHLNKTDQIKLPALEDSTNTYTEAQIKSYANSCVEAGGKYEPVGITGEIGYCDQDYQCREDFDEANADRSLIMLIVLIGIGTGLLILSRIATVKAVELGLSYGGVFMLVGSLGYLFNVGSQLAQLIGIAAALLALVYFAHKKLKD